MIKSKYISNIIKILSILTLLPFTTKTMIKQEVDVYATEQRRIITTHTAALNCNLVRLRSYPAERATQEVLQTLQLHTNVIAQEKKNFLNEFKEEFKIDDQKWYTCIQLIDLIKNTNNRTCNQPLLSTMHDVHMPAKILSLMKQELEAVHINPNRIHISMAHQINEVGYQCPQPSCFIQNDTIIVGIEFNPGLIILPPIDTFDDKSQTLTCRIIAYSIAQNITVERDTIFFALPFLNISQESFFSCASYRKAILKLPIHAVLMTALTNQKNAEDLLAYSLEGNLPLLSIDDFKTLSTIKTLWQTYTQLVNNQRTITETKSEIISKLEKS